MLNPGTKVGHYSVVEKIGAGAMGEVYRATDTRLERDVAIKVLPAGTLADESARKRFRKEALTLSKLNHPHIATVFDFDTQEGVDFLVLEYVAGETLVEKLKRGPLPEKEVGRLGIQIAEALEEAHEHGVVHRDLKPGNIALTAKGQVKVLDFGIAKLLRSEKEAVEATTESFPDTQTFAGTLPYMAPEQVRGEAVDARTDIHALGAVLYEMATGQRPFPETQGPRLIDAILHQAPQPPSGLNRRVSPGLEGIILKALEKEPENRYQSAKELAVDLRRLGTPGSAAAVLSARRPATRRRMVWAAGVALVALLAVLVGLNVAGLRDRLLGGVAPGRITSLAVLPLQNLMGDSEQDYFVAGMHEALITELAKIGALKVISRTSAMRYRDTDKSVPEIADELGVDAVVEGSVLRAGDTVRVTTQLIDGRTDQHLWADNFDHEMRDILALYSDIARAIAREIEITVTPEDTMRLASTRPVIPEAYDAYLKGRYFWNKRTREDLPRAVEQFQRAVELDPGYALAYVGLADSYLVLPPYNVQPPREAMPKAQAAARKALETDQSLGEAHTTMAAIKHTYEWDWAGAERAFNRALELDPNYATAHQWYAEYLRTMGRHDEAIREMKRALELDPVSLIINAGLGWCYYYARQFDLAIEQCRKALELEPDFGMARSCLLNAYLQAGAVDELIAESQRFARLRGASQGEVAEIRRIYEAGGLEGLWRLGIERGRERMAKGEYMSKVFWFAADHAQLGEKEEALAWLEKAYEERDPYMADINVRVEFDPLRDDPRFQSLLLRLNFPE